MAEATFANDLTLSWTNNYDKTFDDKGTGAVEDCSIWTPSRHYWFSGVLSNKGYSSPAAAACVCTEFKGDALADPDGFERIWNDKGSRSSDDRSIWKPKPPAGYVACGHLAIGRRDHSFDNDRTPVVNYISPFFRTFFGETRPYSTFPNFKCVRKDLCVQANQEGVRDNILYNVKWSDRGSPCKKSVWVFEVVVAGHHFMYAYNKENRPTFLDGSRLPEVWVPKAVVSKLLSNLRVDLIPVVEIQGEGKKGKLTQTYSDHIGFKNIGKRKEMFEVSFLGQQKEMFEVAMKAALVNAGEVIAALPNDNLHLNGVWYRARETKKEVLTLIASQITYQEEAQTQQQITVDMSQPLFIYKVRLTGRFDGQEFVGHTNCIYSFSEPKKDLSFLAKVPYPG